MSKSERIVGVVEPVDRDEITARLSERQYRALADADAVLAAGDFVRQLRKKAGLDQKALAEKSGLAQEQISDLERAAGRKGPTIATLARVAQAAGEELVLVTRREVEELRKAADDNARPRTVTRKAGRETEPRFTFARSKKATLSDVTAPVAEAAGLEPATLVTAAGHIFRGVEAALQVGVLVQIAGFGQFEVVERPARAGRNPRTGQAIPVEAAREVKFRAGTRLRETIREVRERDGAAGA